MQFVFSVLCYFGIFAFLAALAYRDVREYILPDILNFFLAITFILFHLLQNWELLSWHKSILGGVGGGGLLLLVRFIANKYYHQDALGLGDVKLVAAGGLGLGLPGIMLAICIGSVLGLIHGLILGLVQKKRTCEQVDFTKINVPAGLGLAAGIGIVTLAQFGLFWV